MSSAFFFNSIPTRPYLSFSKTYLPVPTSASAEILGKIQDNLVRYQRTVNKRLMEGQ